MWPSLGDDVCENGSAEGNKVFSLLWQQSSCDLIDTSQYQEYSPIKVLIHFEIACRIVPAAWSQRNQDQPLLPADRWSCGTF